MFCSDRAENGKPPQWVMKRPVFRCISNSSIWFLRALRRNVVMHSNDGMVDSDATFSAVTGSFNLQWIWSLSVDGVKMSDIFRISVRKQIALHANYMSSSFEACYVISRRTFRRCRIVPSSLSASPISQTWIVTSIVCGVSVPTSGILCKSMQSNISITVRTMQSWMTSPSFPMLTCRFEYNWHCSSWSKLWMQVHNNDAESNNDDAHWGKFGRVLAVSITNRGSQTVVLVWLAAWHFDNTEQSPSWSETRMSPTPNTTTSKLMASSWLLGIPSLCSEESRRFNNSNKQRQQTADNC